MAVAIAGVVIAVVALNLTDGSSAGDIIGADEFPAYAHIIGDADAPVTVVEFSDFQ